MPIDWDGAGHPPAAVRFSYVSDLCTASMLAAGLPSRLAGFDPAWRRAQLDSLGAEALGFLERTRDFWCPVLSLVDYVALTREFDDPEAFFAAVEAEAPSEFLYRALNGDLSRPEVEAGLRNPASSPSLAPKLSCFSRMGPSSLQSLFADPAGFRGRMLDYVRANRTAAFEAKLRETEGLRSARVREIEAMLAKDHPLQVAGTIKGKVFPRKDYVSYDFLPSYFVGDLNISSCVDDRFVMCFSLSAIDAAAGARSRAKADRITAGLRAVADPTRMEILRMLRMGPSYGKAIAEGLGVTTATVSRHLEALKAAGVVAEDPADSQNVKLVSISREGVADLLDQAREALLGG